MLKLALKGFGVGFKLNNLIVYYLCARRNDIMTFAVQLPNVEKHNRTRRSASIAAQLKEMILDGVLKPGDRLPTEEQLCKHFGVSRTTLRESVQMLRVSGLLEVTPGRGSYVCLPDLDVLMQDFALYGCYGSINPEQIQSFRKLIEVEMVGKACETSQSEKNKLHNYVVQRNASPEENEQLEAKWHMEIATLGQNRICGLMLSALLNVLRKGRTERLKDADEVLRTMEVQIRLNSCISDGDVETAQRIMSSYLTAITSSIRQGTESQTKVNTDSVEEVFSQRFELGGGRTEKDSYASTYSYS